MNELKSARVAFLIFVVGEVAATFAHPFFWDSLHRGGVIATPGAAFSIVGGMVLLYFVASIERATHELHGRNGGNKSLVFLGALGIFPGIRVITDVVLLRRAARDAIVDDDAWLARVNLLLAARVIVQVAGLVPVFFLHRDNYAASDVTLWIAPVLSLLLVLMVGRIITSKLVDAHPRMPTSGQGTGDLPVAVPTTRAQ